MESKSKGKFPLEIRKLNEMEKAAALKDVNGGYMKYFIRVGPQGYFYSNPFEDLVPDIYNMELRPDDIFVATFPKVGTTWTQELVWMVANNCDFKTAKEVPLVERFPFLEYSVFAQNDVAKEQIKKAVAEDPSRAALAEHITESGVVIANKMASPRFLKTHQPFSLLPPDLLQKTKVVYVARDPRDVAVSYFHHQLIMPLYGYKGEFKDFWELFKKDMVDWAPFFSHFKEAWELKDHPNVLFLFYEELLKDMPASIRRVAAFLGKSLTEEQIQELSEHLKFENFKNNNAVNYDVLKELGIIKKDGNFIRKGKAGGWRDYFDEGMAEDAKRWIEEGLEGIDFKFPL